jgi:erythromycin esterase
LVAVLLPGLAEPISAQPEKADSASAVAGPEFATLEGSVTDAEGQPVANALVLVIRKTWPRNRYRQDAFETRTDERGRYALVDLYRMGERCAILVSVYQLGHTLTSIYHTNNEGTRLAPDSLASKPATPVAVQLVDSQGKGVSGARLVALQRKSASGEEHFIYAISADRLAALWTVTDSDGRANLSVLAPGDEATVAVDAGGTLRQLTFKADKDRTNNLTLPDEVRASPVRPARRAPRPLPRPDQSQPSNPAHVDWVRKHAIVLRSIDPADTDFGDLAALEPLIGDARIVMLGEQSHGDGAAFHTKTRLIKHLHQRMGFDVLAFESGLYDCRKSWSAFRDGQPARAAAELGVFGIWTLSEQTQPLFEYLAASATSDRPLELAGFDSQMTAAASRLHLADDIKSLAAKLGPDAIAAETLSTVLAGLDPLQKSETLGERLQMFTAGCKEFETACREAAASGQSREEMLFWSQYFRSLSALGRQRSATGSSREGGNLRDQQMAENLAWLATTAYPHRRIIVWAASFHIMSNQQTIIGESGESPYTNTRTMGHELRSHIDPRHVFTIGFTASEGQAGAWMRPARTLPAPTGGSLEDVFARTGQENFVLGLRDLDADGGWLASPLTASPLGYAPMTADWTRVFDAMVFNRVMYPSTRKK